MSTIRRAATAAIAAIALTTGAAACGGSDATAEVTDETATETSAATASTDAGVKVSANDATEEELIAALEAAGVEPAAQWADEIIEYRPHEAGFAKLSEELAKYNPSPETLEKILSVLEP